MTTTIAAGYVVIGEHAIYGVGATADESWGDFRSEMKDAGIAILADDQDSHDYPGSWTRESNHKLRPATAGLLAEVKASGGAIAWGTTNGVACTIQEADEEAAAQ